FLALAEEAESKLKGPQQVVWFARLEREHDNLRAALRWAEQQVDTETVLRIGVALYLFWLLHGHAREGLRWLEYGLAHGADVPAAIRARASLEAGSLA